MWPAMPDLSIPLVNRGAEALEALLNYDPGRAEENVRHLTLSEITALAVAAGELATLCRKYYARACAVCGSTIVWDAHLPTVDAPRWRHVDEVVAVLVGDHRARPGEPGSEGEAGG